jgi:hypothetical protein
MIRIGVAALAVFLIAAPSAVAATDTVAPSAPANLRAIGAFAGQPVLAWDASTDNSGVISNYRVMINGAQAYRPRVTTVKVDDLVRYCHVMPGQTYTIAIQAVDPSGNRSASSNSMQVTVS